MTTRCGEALVGVSVAGEVAMVGYHAGVEEVGLAYHHPDKVATLGPDVQKAAEEKFKEVQHAYEAICKERCM